VSRGPTGVAPAGGTREDYRAFADVGRMARTTLTGRCPACERASAFAGPYRLHATCPSCGVRFERDAGSFLGSLAVGYGLAILALVAYAAIVIPRYGLSDAVVAGLVAVALVAVPVLYRPAKAWWLWWMWAAGFVHRDDAASGDRVG
jgi:uncharacterized protein (DUF983 family)